MWATACNWPLREAFYIVQQGIADAATVDDVMKYSLGRRWNLVGPLASIDLGGLDVFYDISTYLFDDMDDGTGPSPLLAEKVREGNLGAQTGQGFFSWQGEERTASASSNPATRPCCAR